MSPLLMHAANSSVPMEPLDDMDETASESNDGTEHTSATTATPGKVFKYNSFTSLIFSMGLVVRIFLNNE